ncbi:hypothetical protein [Facklamia sp. P9177]|uniref:hypothetical protein n=1 Tax=Facklamia sp. P9177 TaxID=3421945 RepID=UPI003D181D0D
MKKKANNEIYPIIDERQRKYIGELSSIIVVVTIFYLLVEITYKYVRTKDISATNWEIILLLLIGIIYLIGLRSDKELFLPTSFSGKKLTIGKSK